MLKPLSLLCCTTQSMAAITCETSLRPCASATLRLTMRAPGAMPVKCEGSLYGAAAASSGAVGLFHVVGATPEAPDLATATGGRQPLRTITLTATMLRAARDRLSTAAAGTGRIDAVAVGSPHFSVAEFTALDRLTGGRRFAVPFYACTGRGVLAELERADLLAPLKGSGVEIVVDTCVVVAPILPREAGVLMTNSGKFAFYAPANTGFATVYGSLADCVASAVAGRVSRDERLWS